MLAAVDAAGHDAATLHRAYQELITETIETIGEDAVLEGTDLDADTVGALAADADGPAITLADAAVILALDADLDADAKEADADAADSDGEE